MKTSRSALLLSTVLIAACRASSPAPSETLLIGGAEAAPGQFPSTVHFGSCTGVKVAPDAFLTAAHCVVDRDRAALSPAYRAGATFTLTSAVRPDGAARKRLTVVATRIHPAYAERLRSLAGRPQVDGDYSDVPDLALIRVREATPEIEVAPLRAATVDRGARIVVTGYGCEAVPGARPGGGLGDDPFGGTVITSTSGDDDDGRGARLKFGATTVSALDPTKLVIRDRADAFGQVALKLCPGDSGGPVFLDAPREVVGINSYGHLNPRDPYTPSYSAATRLDDDGRYRVATCLAAALTREEPAAPGEDALPALCATPEG